MPAWRAASTDRPQSIAEWRHDAADWRQSGDGGDPIERRPGPLARAARKRKAGTSRCRARRCGARAAAALVLLAGGGYLAFTADVPATGQHATLSLSADSSNRRWPSGARPTRWPRRNDGWRRKRGRRPKRMPRPSARPTRSSSRRGRRGRRPKRSSPSSRRGSRPATPNRPSPTRLRRQSSAPPRKPRSARRRRTPPPCGRPRKRHEEAGGRGRGQAASR